MAQAEVKVDVSEIVKARIEVALAEALSQDPTKLVEAVVKTALSQKKDSWSSETLLQATIKTMIQEAAHDAFKKWVEENKPKIENAVKKRLAKENDDFISTLAEKLVTGMAQSFYVDCRLNIPSQD